LKVLTPLAQLIKKSKKINFQLIFNKKLNNMIIIKTEQKNQGGRKEIKNQKYKIKNKNKNQKGTNYLGKPWTCSLLL